MGEFGLEYAKIVLTIVLMCALLGIPAYLVDNVHNEAQESINEVKQVAIEESSSVEEINENYQIHENVDEDYEVSTEIKTNSDMFEVEEFTVDFTPLLVIFAVVATFVLGGLGIALLYEKIKSYKTDKALAISEGRVAFEDPFSVISEFCNNSSINLSTDLMMKIAEMSKTSSFYRKLVYDFSQFENLSDLKSNISSVTSPYYLIYFFYMTKGSFVVLGELDMRSLCLNYLKDAQKYYKRITKEFGVVKALDIFNEDLMLDFTPNDIDTIKIILNRDENKNTDKDCKIPLIVYNTRALEKKYEEEE